MKPSLYALCCPLCREKLIPAGSDGELRLYHCRRHGEVVLSSDARLWVDQPPEVNTLAPDRRP